MVLWGGGGKGPGTAARSIDAGGEEVPRLTFFLFSRRSIFNYIGNLNFVHRIFGEKTHTNGPGLGQGWGGVGMSDRSANVPPQKVNVGQERECTTAEPKCRTRCRANVGQPWHPPSPPPSYTPCSGFDAGGEGVPRLTWRSIFNSLRNWNIGP